MFIYKICECISCDDHHVHYSSDLDFIECRKITPCSRVYTMCWDSVNNIIQFLSHCNLHRYYYFLRRCLPFQCNASGLSKHAFLEFKSYGGKCCLMVIHLTYMKSLSLWLDVVQRVGHVAQVRSCECVQVGSCGCARMKQKWAGIKTKCMVELSYHVDISTMHNYNSAKRGRVPLLTWNISSSELNSEIAHTTVKWSCPRERGACV